MDQAPRTPTTLRYRILETSRDIRLMIQSALLFQVPLWWGGPPPQGNSAAWRVYHIAGWT